MITNSTNGESSSPAPEFNQGEMLAIIRAEKLPPHEWPGPVFYDDRVYMSANVMLESLRLSKLPAPDHVFAARISEVSADAESIVKFIFPDGLPSFDDIPKETSKALHALISAAHKVSKAPGMQRLVKDREVVIVLNEEEFNSRIVAGLAHLSI